MTIAEIAHLVERVRLELSALNIGSSPKIEAHQVHAARLAFDRLTEAKALLDTIR